MNTHISNLKRFKSWVITFPAFLLLGVQLLGFGCTNALLSSSSGSSRSLYNLLPGPMYHGGKQHRHLCSSKCAKSLIPKKRRSRLVLAFALHSNKDNNSLMHDTVDVDMEETVPLDLLPQIRAVADDLWADEEFKPFSLSSRTIDKHDDSTTTTTTTPTALNVPSEGEAELPSNIPYPQRAKYFQNQALKGDPKAQHSYALLLWNTYGNVKRNPESSAKYHAAAASMLHLDGMAALGGCLRTGTGVKRNVALGLKLIDYCASVHNPTGVNKKAALLESNGDNIGEMGLYQSNYNNGRVNALMLFNIGWCYIHGQGIDKDREIGIGLIKDAASMAPDEGSEEAAWFLYEEFQRDDPREADKWLRLAEDLGYEE